MVNLNEHWAIHTALNYRADRKGINTLDWDIDDDTGNLCYSFWLEDTLFLPEEMIGWFKENIKDEFFHTYEEVPRVKGRIIVFYFRKAEDAFLFKLTWG